jgi:hypothetical protein
MPARPDPSPSSYYTRSWVGLYRVRVGSLFVWLVADGWCWFVLREKYCWLVADGWFVLREKYYWLVADEPYEQGAGHAGSNSWPAPDPQHV